ncbi:unnamed protein product (macronuclear) [Paramecium tetraurelia]|uniref:Uncharacterized protein n=1 Tax=Paramecium tetraurelia TaxID=5888 RepID=A0C145_PARTE|nr:uncharacterized protein GSPATT00033988001 [Paramecium tetraurelia]CAK64512.1 unnamed protein product [Paramecium tetraurelia]|eukprot:XP_001431910.1 hypothetical protein (macronuclear) [Paramecium tetraurelia strain d4-2]
MFQQLNNTIQACRFNLVINYTPKRLVLASPSGIGNSNALKKKEEFRIYIELYKQRETHYQNIIFSKDQEISMMKSHIQQIEERKSYKQYPKQYK